MIVKSIQRLIGCVRGWELSMGNYSMNKLRMEQRKVFFGFADEGVILNTPVVPGSYCAPGLHFGYVLAAYYVDNYSC